MTSLSDKGYRDLATTIRLNGWYTDHTRVFLNGVANKESRESLRIYFNRWLRTNVGEDTAQDVDILLGIE